MAVLIRPDEVTIVIVDDDADMAEFVSDAVEELGYAPVIARSGHDCMGLLAKLNPVCVIMDVVMPDMDGVELVGKMSGAGCRSRVIVMSGYEGRYLASVSLIAESKGVDVLGTLQKPFSIDDLENLLSLLDMSAESDRPLKP